ncbi:MAG TPA: IS1595 family transposase [Xanthobacteraceae bacterium]|nr:IS1595 family transposase [Xanthobacteraceae bacterium]
MSILSEKHFHNEAAAIARLESLIWENGPVCPRCKGEDRITRVNGGRAGLWRCGPCKRQFTVKVGTVFESSHVPLHKWFQAAHLMASSKKGISAHQLHRTLKVTYKTAWFMEHRLREAMRAGSLVPPLGGEGKAVEADETFLSHMEGRPKGRTGTYDRRKVLTLVERGGEARSFHIQDLRNDIIWPIVRKNIARESALMTDEARHYHKLGKTFARHEAVEHNEKEYVRGDAHINTAESFFALFKRGMRGVYQHCSEKHLHRYLAEFDFRYNNRVALGVGDEARAERALGGIVGKRLMYRDS